MNAAAHSGVVDQPDGIFFNVIQMLSDAGRIFGTLSGQGDATPYASEQGHAKTIFQTGHLAMNCAMGEREFLCSPGKTAKPGSRLKGLQGTQIGDPLAHWNVP